MDEPNTADLSGQTTTIRLMIKTLGQIQLSVFQIENKGKTGNFEHLSATCFF
jgi:hypothetical protein